MYKDFFGLNELPFSIAPDPRYLYMSEKHQEALAHLVYGINTEGGFVLLTGEVGTGKTTICRCLLEHMPANSDIAFVLNPKVTVEELLAMICDELGISYPETNTSIKVFVDRINEYLLDAHARGRNTVLIIEESQNLRADVLEQVRLLTNLETNQHKLLQIIMVGQPELREMLSYPELRQLSQRITARYHLASLSRKEVSAYVAHRLSVAGVHNKVFPESTIDRLFRLSGGIPRLINLICDRAMLGAFVQGQNRVSRTTLFRAAREVLGETGRKSPQRQMLKWVLASLLFTICGAAIASNYYNQRALPSNADTKMHTEPYALKWPSDQPFEISKEMAFQALLKQWNVQYQPQQNSTACWQASARGLSCMDGQGGLDSLIRLNRPAMIKLFDDRGRYFYITLTEIHGRTATAIAGNEIRAVDVNSISKQWSGEYTLLWQMPPNYQGDIRPGDKGPEVTWLDIQLAVVQGRKAQIKKNLSYDDKLVKQVKKFQSDNGLTPNGIVGPETIIHLDTAAGTKAPELIDREKDK